jgi:hypothetical protein
MNRRKLIALLVYYVCAFSAVAFAADLREYKTDLQGPARLTERPLRVPMPSRLVVYMTGPKMDHDKRSIAALLSSPPAYTTTNYAEITNLVAALCGETDNTARVANATKHVGFCGVLDALAPPCLTANVG